MRAGLDAGALEARLRTICEASVAVAVIADGRPGAEAVGSPVSEAERARCDAFGSLSRRREWLAARAGERVVRAELEGRGIDSRSIHAGVTHSRGLVLVVGWEATRFFGPGAPVLRIGVDLEPADRKISQAAARRILPEGRMHHGLSPLEHWVILEACYKADPEPSGPVTRYALEVFEPRSGRGSVRAEGRRVFDETRLCRDHLFDVLLIRTGEWIVAFAQTR